jgi:hypothetical protein
MKATFPSPRPRWNRGWPVRLATVAVVWASSATGAGALEPVTTTEIVAIEGTEVVLGAGHLAGLNVASLVTLLREANRSSTPSPARFWACPRSR